MELYNATIQNFESKFFVAVVMKIHDHGGDLNSILGINRNGISNAGFINLVYHYWAHFISQFEYTNENIEKAFGVQICEISTRKGKIFFPGKPIWASNAVYVYKKKKGTNREPTIQYARLTPDIIM